MKTKKKEYNTVEIKGEFAQLLKDIQKQNKQKNTKIKQLQDEIGGYKINHSKMIKLINRAEKNQFNYEQEINDLGKEIVSLKQQLADAKEMTEMERDQRMEEHEFDE